MKNYTEKEASLLLALQRGIPLTQHPFRELAHQHNFTEVEVVALIQRLLTQGDARRFGAVFDTRRLGYRSALCAMQVPAVALEAVAAHITALNGVTHAYERGWPAELPNSGPGAPNTAKWPNLWFTLTAPDESFAQELDALRATCAPHAIHELPALRRFKIDVVFDLRTRDRDERVVPVRAHTDAPDAPTSFNLLQRAIIRLMQGNVPVCERFFKPVADQLGIAETTLIDQLKSWQEGGVLRRLALLLHHREVGFKANGMCCWDLPDSEIMEAGRRVASFPEVTHCYARPWMEAFPFKLYAMIHKPDWRGTQLLFEKISRATNLADGQLLLSVREFKKTSMSFFQ